MNYFKKKLQTFISWYLRRKGWLKLYGGQKYCWIMEKITQTATNQEVRNGFT